MVNNLSAEIQRDTSKPPIFPRNGIIFTAQIPYRTGGVNSDLILTPTPSNLFGKCSSHVTLSNGIFDGYPSIEAGGRGRFIVYGKGLNKYEHITNQNWFRARMLRPLYLSSNRPKEFRRDTTEQAIVSPENTLRLLERALNKNGGIEHIDADVIINDLLYLRNLDEQKIREVQSYFSYNEHKM